MATDTYKTESLMYDFVLDDLDILISTIPCVTTPASIKIYTTNKILFTEHT